MNELTQEQFDNLTEDEKRVQLLADTIRGSVEQDIMDLEKVLSIKLDSSNYPMIKSLSIHSDKSMSFIIGQLVNIGLSSLLKKFSKEELEPIKVEAHAIYNDWVQQVMEERGAK